MPQTKSVFLTGAGALLIICAAWARAADEQTAIVIDTFSSCVKNRLPCKWEKFRDVNDVESIGKRVSYSLHDYPEVHWRWRVNDLPPGAREDIKKKNDSAAGIYVAFKGTFPFNHVIKYVWSTTLPVGTVVKSPHNGKVMIFVIEQGPGNINHWMPEERNVLNDYLRAFGSQPPLVEGIAIQTDSDNTKSSASADFDDIFISKFTE
jgi:hypothetical protein